MTGCVCSCVEMVLLWRVEFLWQYVSLSVRVIIVYNKVGVGKTVQYSKICESSPPLVMHNNKNI